MGTGGVVVCGRCGCSTYWDDEDKAHWRFSVDGCRNCNELARLRAIEKDQIDIAIKNCPSCASLRAEVERLREVISWVESLGSHPAPGGSNGILNAYGMNGEQYSNIKGFIHHYLHDKEHHACPITRYTEARKRTKWEG